MKALSGSLLGAALMVCALARADSLTTQDYIDIEQLYAQYNHAIDSCDAQAWAATFTEDGTFIRYTGREALEGFVRQWCTSMDGASRRHWNTNLRITPDAQGASGAVLLMLLDISGRPASIVSTGLYNDRLVKTAAGWRFKSRAIKSDAPAATPSKG